MMKKKSVTLAACKEEALIVCDSLLFKKKIPLTAFFIRVDELKA